MDTREITSDNYCIEERTWCCTDCGHRFTEYAPLGGELACFDGEDGNRYFLPVYGRHGYLELMERLMPERNPAKPILPDTVDEFLRRLCAVTAVRLSSAPARPCCPQCGGKTVCEKRTTLHNHPVAWVSISEHFLDGN